MHMNSAHSVCKVAALTVQYKRMTGLHLLLTSDITLTLCLPSQAVSKTVLARQRQAVLMSALLQHRPAI